MSAWSSLGDLISSSSSDDSDTSLMGSLSQLAQSTVQDIAGSAADAATNAVDQAINPTRSTNTAPAPDLVAKAAVPSATFTKATVAGVSLPVVLLGLGAVLYFASHK